MRTLLNGILPAIRTFVSHIVYNSNLHNQCIRRESSFFLVTITSFSASLYSNRNGAIFSRSPRTFSRSVFSDVIVKYTSQADWSSILKFTSAIQHLDDFGQRSILKSYHILFPQGRQMNIGMSGNGTTLTFFVIDKFLTGLQRIFLI